MVEPVETTTTEGVAISLRDVVKTFPGAAAPAVSGLSLDIAEGHLVALVGPSGCGKTTTLKMINRLIEPTSGTIEVLGADQRAVPAHELRRSIGYVIQQVGLFPHQTIRRNIAAVPELLGWNKRRIAERCDELVELVGLAPDLLDRYPAELSGGQQQRVGVARALAADPPVLLMDEPYSAVDPIVRERLQEELLALQARVRKTIVFVTHDVDEAIRLADRVVVLDVGGVLAQYATPDELLSAPASEFVARFLGRERGLRRLALLRVADITPVAGPVVRSSDPADAARAAAAKFDTTWFGVVDDDVLLGWADVATLTGAASAGTVPLQPFVATVTPGTALREALDVVVTSRSRMAAVVDDGRYLGMITVDQIAGGLES
ncbi:MAG TPA: ATP-binding cassette domain-containing protein [Ilumatobacter sp.]|nr:ATP-binding cassette domain-containing protein [Ilumatobacter sp.]